MPILKVDSGKNSTRVGHYLYINREGDERAEAFASNTGARDLKEAETEFRGVRTAFVQKGSAEFHQAYISFQRSDLGSLEKPDGSPDWTRIAEYGHEWARRAGISERHQLYVVAHGDKPHPHIHVIWNATSFEDGRKYHFHGAKELDRFRDINDQLAREHGIKRVLDRTRDPERAADKVIRTAENGGSVYSWKMDLQSRIRAAASGATTEKQFRDQLRERGVTLKIRHGQYGYEFQDGKGSDRFARGERLGEEYKAQPLKERFELHDKILREPGGVAAYVERAARERDAFDSWRRELREAINEAKRRAHDMPSFEKALEKKGIIVHSDPRSGELKYRYLQEGGIARTITDKDLGRVYDRKNLEGRFEENAFRRQAASDIGKAIRKAGNEEDLRARLAEKGIRLDRVGDRYVYEVQHGGRARRIEGEQLGRAYRTERVEERFGENSNRKDLYGIAMAARRDSTSREDYLRRLGALGVQYQKDEKGRGQLSFRGHTYEAGGLGKANPDRALPDGHWRSERATAGAVADVAGRATREVGGLARQLSQEIKKASRDGGQEHGGSDYGRERSRERKRGRGMDSETTGAERF